MGDTLHDVPPLTGEDPAQRMRNTERNTIQFRGLTWVRHILANLHTAHRLGVASWVRPLGGTVFVVSAGASLDRQAHLLPLCQERGPLLVVGTACPAVHYHGVPIDVGVHVDSLDVSDRFEGCRSLAVDLQVHPNVWAQALTRGGWWLSTDSAYHCPLLYRLGVEPIPYAGGVTPAAVALAATWQPWDVVLIGADLAYDPEVTRQVYAEGAGWAGWEVDLDADGWLTFSGREDRDDLHRGGGVPPPPRRREPVWAPRLGGGPPVRTLPDLMAQVHWLERAPGRYPGIRFINATETRAGVEVAGWVEMPLADYLASTPASVGVTATADACLARARVEEAQRWLAETSRPVEELAGGLLGETLPDARELRAMVASNGLLELAASAELIAMKRQPDMSGRARWAATYEITKAAAAEVARLAGGG